MPRILTERYHLISPKEIVETLNNIKNESVRAYVFLLYKTGARKSEIKEVRRKDIEYNDEYWTIKLITLKQRKRKFGIDRVLKIVRDGLFDKVLLPYIEKFKNPEEILFKASKQYYFKALKMANPNLYPHFFRHNLACMLSEYCDTISLQQWFGWRRLDMVLNYTRKRNAIETIFQKQKEILLRKKEQQNFISPQQNHQYTL